MAKSLAELRAKGFDVTASADNYHPAEGTLANGNDVDINLSSLELITSVEIMNDTANRDLLVSVNGGANFSIEGDDTKVIDEILITSITLTNNSGAGVDYRVLAWGF